MSDWSLCTGVDSNDRSYDDPWTAERLQSSDAYNGAAVSCIWSCAGPSVNSTAYEMDQRKNRKVKF